MRILGQAVPQTLPARWLARLLAPARRAAVRRAAALAAAALCAVPAAQAAWNDAWPERRTVVLDTGVQGAGTRAAVNQIVVPVRLHTGNFDFMLARPDGADLRFVAADDQTVLAHRIEHFDPVNELAVVWVAVPTLLPNQPEQAISLYFGNPDAPPVDPAAPVFDARTAFVLQGADAIEQLADAGPGAAEVVAANVAVEPNGIAGAALAFGGEGSVAIGGQPVRVAPEGLTLSLWQRPADATQNAALATVTGATDGDRIEIGLAEGKPVIRLAGAFGSGEAMAATAAEPARWQHLVAVLGDKLVLYVDGQEAASLPATVVPGPARVVLGQGYRGALDEIAAQHVTRSADWVRASFVAQGPDGRMVRIEAGADEAGGEVNYMAILVQALPLDAIIVIAILAVMAVVAAWVMVSRWLDIARATKANAVFAQYFRGLGGSAFAGGQQPAASSKAHAGSTLEPVYAAALAEFQSRMNGNPQYRLESRNLVAIRSRVEAAVLGQVNRLNRFMVLLTIAISGGPFLGLLGTVVGVMITFAAIAAVGDVNINAIAPGIAAALLATVAGLAVAIPALFGYNYLAAKIKELSQETQLFGDEVVSRLAEQHGA